MPKHIMILNRCIGVLLYSFVLNTDLLPYTIVTKRSLYFDMKIFVVMLFYADGHNTHAHSLL